MIDEETNSHNIASIQKITEEMYNEIENFKALLRKHTLANRLRFQETTTNKEREVELLRQKIDAEYTRAARLKKEQTELKESIECEKENYRLVESELNEIRGQITKLNVNKKNQDEVLSSLGSKLYALDRKIDSQQQKKSTRESKVTKVAGYYRRFVGIDIVPEKHNVLRVVFSNLAPNENARGYVMIDFTGEGTVVDIFPQVFSVEKAQVYFKKHADFYEFLKSMRSSFQHEFEK